MKTIKISYHTSVMEVHVPKKNLKSVIRARADGYVAAKTEKELVQDCASFFHLECLRFLCVHTMGFGGIGQN